MKIMPLGGSGCGGAQPSRRLRRDGRPVSVVTRHATGAKPLDRVLSAGTRHFDPCDLDRLGNGLSKPDTHGSRH